MKNNSMLQERINRQVATGPRRAVFILHGTSLDIRYVSKIFRGDICRLYGHLDYRLTWFRNRDDSSITVMVSGARSAVDHLPKFLSNNRGLFEAGYIIYSGIGEVKFAKAVAKLLADYDSNAAGHKFGGTPLVELSHDTIRLHA